jgi:hypothetical protein
VAAVAVDLGVDQLEAVVQLCELVGDAPPLLVQHLQPLGLVAGALADELRQPADRRERHPRRPEQHAVAQPLDVPGAVDTAAGRVTAYLAGQQPGTFVQAQRVHAQPGPLRHLPDAQAVPGHLANLGEIRPLT